MRVTSYELCVFCRECSKSAEFVETRKSNTVIDEKRIGSATLDQNPTSHHLIRDAKIKYSKSAEFVETRKSNTVIDDKRISSATLEYYKLEY